MWNGFLRDPPFLENHSIEFTKFGMKIVQGVSDRKMEKIEI